MSKDINPGPVRGACCRSACFVLLLLPLEWRSGLWMWVDANILDVVQRASSGSTYCGGVTLGINAVDARKGVHLGDAYKVCVNAILLFLHRISQSVLTETWSRNSPVLSSTLSSSSAAPLSTSLAARASRLRATHVLSPASLFSPYPSRKCARDTCTSTRSGRPVSCRPCERRYLVDRVSADSFGAFRRAGFIPAVV